MIFTSKKDDRLKELKWLKKVARDSCVSYPCRLSKSVQTMVALRVAGRLPDSECDEFMNDVKTAIKESSIRMAKINMP